MAGKGAGQEQLFDRIIANSQLDFKNSLAKSLRFQIVKIEGKSPVEIIQTLQENNLEVSDSVQKSIYNFEDIPGLKTRRNVTLVHFEVGKVFPFLILPTLEEVNKRALDLGFVLSPANVIEDINLYKESPPNKSNDLIMEPIIDHSGFPSIFTYGRYDLTGLPDAIDAVGDKGTMKRMWLGIRNVDSKTRLYPEQRITFALPTKK